MPAFADITINDGQAAPVAHTFSPTSRENGLAVWHERSATVAQIGWNWITYRAKFPAPGRPGSQADEGSNVEHTVTLAQVKMETLGVNDAGVTPPPTIAYIHRTSLVFKQPTRGTQAERKDQRAYAQNLLGHATMQSLLHDQTAITG